MKICILGDTGLLGQALVRAFQKESTFSLLGISTTPLRPTFPSSSPDSYHHRIIQIQNEEKLLMSTLEEFNPDVVINCVALINLMACENDKELAKDLNEHLPKKLSIKTKELGSAIVQISTDQVYDGREKQPYKETMGVGPINNYGLTKWNGEFFAQEHNSHSLVLRTNIVGFRDKENSPTFAEWLTDSLFFKKEITLFEDYITSSIHVDDFASVLIRALQKGIRGVYNLGSRDNISKHEFGARLAEEMGLGMESITKGKMAIKPLYPPRPSYLALDGTKIEDELNLVLPNARETIRKIARDFKMRMKEKTHA